MFTRWTQIFGTVYFLIATIASAASIFARMKGHSSSCMYVLYSVIERSEGDSALLRDLTPAKIQRIANDSFDFGSSIN